MAEIVFYFYNLCCLIESLLCNICYDVVVDVVIGFSFIVVNKVEVSVITEPHQACTMLELGNQQYTEKMEVAKVEPIMAEVSTLSSTDVGMFLHIFLPFVIVEECKSLWLIWQ